MAMRVRLHAPEEFRTMTIRLKTIALLFSAGLTWWLAGVAMAQSTPGEVRKIDKAQGKITLQHGPIESLKMPPMTMAYRVQNPAWLEQVKEGDKVRFDAEKVNGQYVVTALKPGP
jgi:Cu(I)/Ag(I) efflux system periplasmic protein CusF